MNKKQIANRSIVRALAAQGKSTVQIERVTGCGIGVINRYLRPTRAEAREAAQAEREQRRAERESLRNSQQAERTARRAERLARRAAREARTWAARRNVLRVDGEHALALLAQGLKPRDVLLVIGGSRARLYRALDAARTVPDPLLS